MTNTFIPGSLEALCRSSRRILLLQGPVGPFFKTFSQWLTENRRKTVFKLNFNYGDEVFYPLHMPRTFAYRDTSQ
ncbi:capsule biosynthesis protein, partial [Bacillus stratosphericus]